MPTPVDRIHSEYKAIVGEIETEPSLLVSINDHFRKVMLLAAASYFEHRLSTFVEIFAFEASGSSTLIRAAFKAKVIERQYHTWFDWKGRNANQFYRLFGEQFTEFMASRQKTEDWLVPAIQAFLELGRSRNSLVHENYGAFNLEKTADEIYTLYQQALPFVEAVPSLLRECNQMG